MTRRLLGPAARVGTAVAAFLLLLTLSRLGPVYAEPPVLLAPLTGSALRLMGGMVVLAVLAALQGHPARKVPTRPLVIGLIASLAGLLLVVSLRPPAGLAAQVAEGETALATLEPRPVDLIGRDLRHLPRLRRARLSWDGELRVPRTGTYRMFALGRGRVEVRVDDWPALGGEGDPLRTSAQVPLTEGTHRLSIRLARDGPGARLQLLWASPGPFGDTPLVVIPTRHLGPPLPRAFWWLTDLFALAAAACAGLLVMVLPWDARRVLPAPAHVANRTLAAAALGYALILAIMSWPLLTDPAHLGMTDRPDGRLNAWIMAWDVHALLNHPLRLFDAPAFHPSPDALAFSENLVLPAILTAPFQWLGGPVLAYNVALLASFLVSGLGVFLLVRRVTSDSWAAFVAGALFAAGGHRWIRMAHLHAQVTWFMPFVLLALDRFWEKRSWRPALLAGLLLGLQGLSSVYVGAITALLVAVTFVVMILGGLRRAELAKPLAGLAVSAVVLLPVMLPYLRMRSFQGMEFTLAEVKTYATTLESYAASGTRLYGALTQRHLDPERVQDTLFPGLVLLVLGVSGLAAAPARYRAVAVLASAAAIVFSLGPETGLYRLLHEHVVLVRGVRALSRFSLIPILCLCVLTGLFLAGRRVLVTFIALLAALAESSQVPLGYGRWEGPSDAARWLAGREGAVAVLPLGEDDTQAMLDGVAHWRPLVNGDSGFIPRPYARLLELLGEAPGDEGLRLLRAVGVRHLVSTQTLPLPESARFGGQTVYELTAGGEARAPVPGVPVATHWLRPVVILDLGELRQVSRILFEASDAGWVDRPGLRVSADGQSWINIPARVSLADTALSLLQDPRHGRGEIKFPPVEARFLRLEGPLPARPGLLEVGD